MKIDHVHFYVEDARASRNWFISHLGFQAVASGINSFDTCTEVVKSGSVYFVLSSPLTPKSPVAQFLRQHPPGVTDIAFCVDDLQAVMTRAIAHGAKVLQPIQQYQSLKWSKIAAWGSLSHTLIQKHCESESRGAGENLDIFFPQPLCASATLDLSPSPDIFTSIDHVVLNVASGDLERAVAWYKKILDFQSKQTFKIQTDRSALHSQVMISPNSSIQFPVNEPASPNSQIQEFLDVNRGPGIQHIALHTFDIVQAIAKLRPIGLSLLPVPPSYYTQLQQRPGLPLSVAQLQQITQEQILVDWEDTTPNAVLLQTFTQPIFGQPTFFFELIERRCQARGFGEGNFRALFEAIEREQLKRGNLK